MALSDDSIEVLTQRAVADPDFMERLRMDPEATLQEAGVALSEEDRVALLAAGGSLGEALQARISLNSACFTGPTRITMADGTVRPISHIRAGDLVLGGSGCVNRVMGILTPLLGNKLLYAFNGGEAFVSCAQSFMTEAGWKSVDPARTALTQPDHPVSRLATGDRLLSLAAVAALVGGASSSGEAVDVRIEAITLQTLEGSPADPGTQLYDLLLDGDDTFFANGFLAHNTEQSLMS